MAPEKNIISLQINKEITHLFKSFLEDLENFKKDHDLMLQKVADKNGKEFADSINYLNEDKYNHVRKRILDHGNESDRQLNSFIEYFDFQINNEKLENALKQRKTYKKIVIGGLFSVE